MKDPLGVSPSKGNQGTKRGKEKILLTSVGIEPMTSGLDLPLLLKPIMPCLISMHFAAKITPLSFTRVSEWTLNGI